MESTQVPWKLDVNLTDGVKPFVWNAMLSKNHSPTCKLLFLIALLLQLQGIRGNHQVIFDGNWIFPKIIGCSVFTVCPWSIFPDATLTSSMGWLVVSSWWIHCSSCFRFFRPMTGGQRLLRRLSKRFHPRCSFVGRFTVKEDDSGGCDKGSTWLGDLVVQIWKYGFAPIWPD